MRRQKNRMSRQKKIIQKGSKNELILCYMYFHILCRKSPILTLKFENEA